MPRDLRGRAAKALSHPRFREFARLVPAEDHANPAAILSWWLAAAGLDPRGAASEQGREVHEALRELVGAQQIEHRAATLYHNAISSGLVSQSEADKLWASPELAEAKLAELRGTDAYWSNPLIQEAAALHYELQNMSADDVDPAPAEDAEQPSDEGDGPRSGEFARYMAVKGEPPLLEPEPAPHPRDDDAPRMSIPGPTLFKEVSE